MAYADYEFLDWIEENNLDADDLDLIKKTAAKRAWIYFFLCYIVPGASFIFFLPFFLREWTWYKMIKQGTTTPRYGLIYSLYNLAMLLSFITILPIILWAIFYKGTSLSGYSFLMKKGFIGQGSQGRTNYEVYKQIKKRPTRIKNLICLIITVVGVLVLYIIALFDGESNKITQKELLEIFAFSAITLFIVSEIIGSIVTKIIVNIKYYNS